MAAAGVILIQSFGYRGVPEEFSNTYHFTGTAPSSPADWRSLVDELVTLVKTVFYHDTTIVRALCYEDTSHDSVYTYDLSHFSGVVPGSLGSTPSDMAPGDAAAWVRWNTTRRTSHGKPIYLRKYYHGIAIGAHPVEDTILGAQHTALGALGASLLAATGDWPGLSDLDGGALEGGYLQSTFVTTRTLKRRGRRPT